MTDRLLKFENSVEYDLSNNEIGLSFLDRFHLLDKIHQGMLSQVFVIQDKDTGELFILKAIELSQCSCDLELMRRINHPNIIKVYEAFETNRYLYLRKEYVKGITLEAFVNQERPLDEKGVMEVALKLCDILTYLHSMDSSPAIYRDLKPANLIINELGEIKLIDLDSIRQYKEEAKKDTVYIGTEGFAPPEQFGFGQTDIRSDIYTLGTTLYYLLTNLDPVAGQLKLKYIKDVRRDISDSLGQIIEKCTMFHPDSRYQNVQQLQKELMAICSNNHLNRFLYRLKLTLRMKTVITSIGVTVALISIFLLSISGKLGSLFNQPSSPQTTTTDITDDDTADQVEDITKEQVVNNNSYNDFIGASEPVIDLKKLGVDENDIISLRLEKDGEVIPIQYDMSESNLTLINNRFPANLLEINNEYSLKITTSDNSLYQIKFVPLPQELKGLEGLNIYYMPANPEKGFYYPYYLTLPSKESVEQNKGKKNFLLVEPYHMGQASDDLDVHLELALQNAKINSLSIAEELGLPRLIPIFILPESKFSNMDIYTHTLSRNTILLSKLKRLNIEFNEVFNPMDRIDLQLIEMTKDANEFLKTRGWNMEDQIYLWGKGATGEFANRFTFLHPSLVKAAFFHSLPILPISTLKNTRLPYPFGTSDYKVITGSEFNLEEYNQVAKLGFIHTQYDGNTVSSDLTDSVQDEEKILRLLPPQEYPVRWLIMKDLYTKVGITAQVNLYEDDTLLEQDCLSFFEANRDIDIPIYTASNNPANAMTALFSNNKLSITGTTKNEITVQKATINEAFWSGTLPKTLSDDFIDFYTEGDAWNYNPNCFFISILEWDSTRDHRQMSDRVLIYGGEVTLKADGYKDVYARITEGSMTSFNHGYVYFVELVNGEHLESGVKYKLVDETGNWTVNDDVTVERPIRK